MAEHRTGDRERQGAHDRSGRQSRRDSLGERLARWRERNSLLILLFLASSVVTSVSALTIAALDAYDRYDRRFNWRAREYAKLTALKAGFQVAKFNEVLGEPVLIEPWAPRTRQITYRGRGYWVRAVEDKAGNVAQYAVTSCDHSFRPTFVFHPLTNRRVTLQRSTMRSVGTGDVKLINGAHTLQLYEAIGGSAPEVYKSFAWGSDDACPTDSKLAHTVSGVVSYDGPLSRAPAAIKMAVQSTPVNTYAETAPTVSFGPVDDPYFAIGVHPQTVQLLP